MPATGRLTAAGNRARQRGALFLALLVALAVMGVGLAAAGTFWHQVQQRAKEQQLIFVGLQYKRAIRSYYEASPGIKAYPRNLADLLRDDRFPGTRRHLRRLYLDPIENSPVWGLIMGPGGGIMGVYSLAPGRPIKQAGFPATLGWADGRTHYSEWQFTYLPASGQAGF